MLKKIIKVAIALTMVLTLSHGNLFAVKAYSDYKYNCQQKISPAVLEELKNNNDTIEVTILLDDSNIQTDMPSILKEVYKEKEISKAEHIDVLSADEKLEIVHEIRRINSENIKVQCSNLINQNEEKLKNQGNIVEKYTYIPCVKMSVTPKQIEKLSEYQFVTNIDYFNSIESTQLLNNSREVINADTVQTNGIFGETGEGVRVGIIDEQLPIITREALCNANIVLHTRGSANYPTGSHATDVAEVIASQGSNVCAKGIAPDATLYCTYVTNNSDQHINSLDWLVKNLVDIVNVSLDWSDFTEVQPYNAYYGMSQVLDYYSAKFMITFVVGAGNSGTQGIGAPAMSYNAITVGNIDDKNTETVTDDAIHQSSCHTNQSALTNLPSKPDISAPGTNIILDSASKTGTSIAAPHVAGAAALIGEMDPLLLVSPAAIKATLVAGVKANFKFVPSQRTVTTDTTNPPESYIQCGAGMLDCRRSGQIVKNSRVDFTVMPLDQSEMSFDIECTANANKRVALAFEKTAIETTEGYRDLHYYDNLDLYIYDPNGNLVGSSITTNNNVEIVDFTVTTTGTYTAKIKRGTATYPSNVEFALAWI